VVACGGGVAFAFGGGVTLAFGGGAGGDSRDVGGDEL
jgi:hypothetical protein